MAHKKLNLADLANEAADVEGPPTSIMIKNLPCGCSQEQLLEAIHAIGFGEDYYDFFYMPISPTKSQRQNYGYAFINFVDEQKSLAFQQRIEAEEVGIRRHASGPRLSKKLSVAPAHIQGRDSLMAHFKNTSVMKTIGGPTIKESTLELKRQAEVSSAKAKKANGQSKNKFRLHLQDSIVPSQIQADQAPTPLKSAPSSRPVAARSDMFSRVPMTTTNYSLVEHGYIGQHGTGGMRDMAMVPARTELFAIGLDSPRAHRQSALTCPVLRHRFEKEENDAMMLMQSLNTAMLKDTTAYAFSNGSTGSAFSRMSTLSSDPSSHDLHGSEAGSESWCSASQRSVLQFEQEFSVINNSPLQETWSSSDEPMYIHIDKDYFVDDPYIFSLR